MKHLEPIKRVTQTERNCKEFRKKYGILITTRMTGKMSQMIALSTSALDNPGCNKRAENPNSICSMCYARREMKMYKNMREAYKKNGEVMSTQIIPVEEWPEIVFSEFPIVREEAHGDLVNTTHLINLCNFARRNPKHIFTLWTKMAGIVRQTFDTLGVTKPDNMLIILSSPKVNVPIPVNLERFPYFDKVFTVYSAEYAEKHGININCCDGKTKRQCRQCKRCYTKGTEREVNETIH